jgi:hypothetical protein
MPIIKTPGLLGARTYMGKLFKSHIVAEALHVLETKAGVRVPENVCF